jgi:signal transduction histidine kinase
VLEIDALVGQLLASSRLDFGRMERRPVDGAEAAALALERAGLPAARLEAAADGGLRATADPTLLARALANILANAAEHGGGPARLRVRRDGDALAFEVEDAGPGFSAEELPRVFERFYRGDRKAGGSLGLGLSLVRRIAEAHGGRAWAENLPGGGARVGFSIGPAAAL